MHRALKAAAVVICCTGWAFISSARADQAPAAATMDNATAQPLKVVPVDDPRPQAERMRRDDGRDDARSDARDGRDGRADRQRQSQPMVRRGQGRMNEQAGGQGRGGFGFQERGGRGGMNFMRNGQAGRPFMRGGYDFMRGGSDFMREGRNQSNAMRGGAMRGGPMRGGPVRGGQGRQDMNRDGRGGSAMREGRQFMRGETGPSRMTQNGWGGRDFVRGGQGRPDNAQEGRGQRYSLRIPPQALRSDSQSQIRTFERLKAPAEAQPKPPALGVEVTNPDAELKSQLNLPDGVGLVIEQVLPNTLASRAGLKQYDVLRKIDDQLAINPEQVGVLIRMHKSGDHLQLTVIRQGKEQVLNTTLGEPHPTTMQPRNSALRHRPGEEKRGSGRPGAPANQRGNREPGPTHDTSRPPTAPAPQPGNHTPMQEDRGSAAAPATQPSASISGLLRQFEDAFVD